MIISLSKSDKDDMRTHSFFRKEEVSNMYHLCALICKHQWSPIVWRRGVRKSHMFWYADTLAFDFDGTWTLNEAKAWARERSYRAIIGPTRSHQIARVNSIGELTPPVDRFRMLLFPSERITDLDLYMYNLREICDQVPADRQCTNGSTSFRPCREIAFINMGYTVPVDTTPETRSKLAQAKIELDNYHARTTTNLKEGVVPAWIQRVILFGAKEGTRNITCYKIAATLAAAGWEKNQIISYLGGSDFTKGMANTELRSTVISGWKSAATRQRRGLARKEESQSESRQ